MQDKKPAKQQEAEGFFKWFSRQLSGKTREQAEAEDRKRQEDAKRTRQAIDKAITGYKAIKKHPSFKKDDKK